MAVHYDLSVIAIVGITLLIGIVKKNGIMLVDFALHTEHNEGLTAEESIYKACVLRFRPILMTTMAALLGGVPMMVGTGAGSELRQPLGYTIVGGLLVSQLLTLYTAVRVAAGPNRRLVQLVYITPQLATFGLSIGRATASSADDFNCAKTRSPKVKSNFTSQNPRSPLDMRRSAIQPQCAMAPLACPRRVNSSNPAANRSNTPRPAKVSA